MAAIVCLAYMQPNTQSRKQAVSCGSRAPVRSRCPTLHSRFRFAWQVCEFISIFASVLQNKLLIVGGEMLKFGSSQSSDHNIRCKSEIKCRTYVVTTSSHFVQLCRSPGHEQLHPGDGNGVPAWQPGWIVRPRLSTHKIPGYPKASEITCCMF